MTHLEYILPLDRRRSLVVNSLVVPPALPSIRVITDMLTGVRVAARR